MMRGLYDEKMKPLNLSRRLKLSLVLAFAAVCLLFVALEHGEEWFYYGRLRLPPSVWGSDPAMLIGNAHNFAHADEFLDHFATVITQTGMTMAEAKAGCSWPSDKYVNFQYGPESDWVNNDRSDAELDKRRRQWQKWVATSMIPWEKVKDRFSGKGLVILAGNHDSLMRLRVLLRALLRVGSTIAVEVHYWNGEIRDEVKQELIHMYPYDLTFNDLSGRHNILHVKKNGYFGVNYQLKTAAIVNSRFAEPLFLDSDNIPVMNPERIYESPTYREYHSVFWPDIARTRPQNPMWAITNTACRMDEYEQESGQLLVDKTRFWYHLQLASWLNNEQGSYYNAFLLGDKDMFRFAWHALKTQYGKPNNWLSSVGTVNDGFYCGNSFAQYHPDDGKVAFVHGGLLKTVHPELMEWNLERGGMFRNFKKSPTDEDPGIPEDVTILFDGAGYMGKEHSNSFYPAQCTDIRDVEAQDINELIPGFEKFYEKVGGYWSLGRSEI